MSWKLRIFQYVNCTGNFIDKASANSNVCDSSYQVDCLTEQVLQFYSSNCTGEAYSYALGCTHGKLFTCFSDPIPPSSSANLTVNQICAIVATVLTSLVLMFILGRFVYLWRQRARAFKRLEEAKERYHALNVENEGSYSRFRDSESPA